ncbi:hypothetical protein B4Q04_01560 [Zobellia sp. OII3]|uniref:TPM domain-containing protein n=1 Tax=Zobellia sp. OII3 TaxID=2034520 RepID=UPI000B52DF3F|nr:TPM domain-containing protein [Zobellia sp. OII3]OWW26396.1 hypothetical protein B4Q04_01560 [Zobellia sp. OII3]
MRKKAFTLVFLLGYLFAAAQQQYYELRDFVTDSAQIFTAAQVFDLNQKLVDFERETTNQLVVVTIDKLDFETIETYANGLFNQNGIGQSGKDNGLLVLFSKFDREVRIEVGYGLEPYITDAVASRIIRNTMIPNFKDERYYEGIDAAVNQMINFLNDPEALAEFKSDIAASERKAKTFENIFLGVFALLFVGVGGFSFFRGYRTLIEVFRGVFTGKLGVLPGFVMLISASFFSLLGLVFILALLGVVYNIYTSESYIGYNIARLIDDPYLGLWGLLPFWGIAICIALIKLKLGGKEDLKLSWIKSDKAYVGRTFSSSGTHSFSSGGSSGSFSGGGGGSGGGGASGSW